MHAMLLESTGSQLKLVDLPVPECGQNQVLLKVLACGVCRTDLHIVDGELSQAKLPLIPGHEIVGTIVAMGKQVRRFHPGERVGVPWLSHTCGHCAYCTGARENLCDSAQFTGYNLDGGYAEYALADQDYAFHLPETYSDAEA